MFRITVKRRSEDPSRAEEGFAAVDHALSILDAFADTHSKLSLAEISKRTGLYKSTVLRLTKSLEKYRYMRRSENGAYRLGSKAKGSASNRVAFPCQVDGSTSFDSRRWHGSK